MRARTIKPGFFTDEGLADCSPLARILFAGLWCLADRAGKLHDRPRQIKAELLPYEAIPDADALLAELERGRMIVRYEVAGERYIKIPGFEKHQNPHPKEKTSEIPEPFLSAARPDLSAARSGVSGTDRAHSNPSVSPLPSPATATAAAESPVRLAGGEDEDLGSFRRALASRLGVGSVSVGRDRVRILAAFRSQLAMVGEESLLDECSDLARKSTTGVPTSLAWFVPWLERLPDPVAVGGSS
jgi:hypothetical protein